MKPRITVITIGVDDLERSLRAGSGGARGENAVNFSFYVAAVVKLSYVFFLPSTL
jgi:hypothetical protein